MKSAEERAADVAALLDWEPLDARRTRFTKAAAGIIREAFRDQRHLCAEAVSATLSDGTRGDAHTAVMNARAPGT